MAVVIVILNSFRIAILGSANAGKSTLCGVLTQGHLDNGHGKVLCHLISQYHIKKITLQKNSLTAFLGSTESISLFARISNW